jgi:predicted phage terminase large subunit-like protein
VLQGFTVEMLQPVSVPVGSGIDAKVFRAEPFATAMENGLIQYVPGDWVGDFFDELDGFPSGDHDDQVDAAAYAFNWLRRYATRPAGRATTSAGESL